MGFAPLKRAKTKIPKAKTRIPSQKSRIPKDEFRISRDCFASLAMTKILEFHIEIPQKGLRDDKVEDSKIP